jgi:plastocyanin
VVIRQMAFGLTPSGLHVGDVVEWVNDDIFQHTATARDGSFDLVLRPKARAQTLLRKPGTIQVYCRFHPGMTLALNVAPASKRR